MRLASLFFCLVDFTNKKLCVIIFLGDGFMIENELKILEVDKNEFIKKIKSMGAETVFENLKQCRYVYDIDSNDKNKWIRLRTNGLVSTLTIKKILDTSKIDGTEEHEVEVSNFEETNKMLNIMGFKARSYQENLRSFYKLDDVEISVDSWPLIPTYAEIEGKNVDDVLKLTEKLNIDKSKITTKDVTSIYNDFYGIDLLKIENLKLD